MDYAINLATAADSWKVVKRAEELGFARAWFFDTQLLNADVFVAMAAAAMQTTKIKLATGVLIPSNRIAPVTANALASLNSLAPGRICFGVATGFTARRTMGVGAMKLADTKDYIEVVRDLLDLKTVDWPFEGKSRKIKFLNPDLELINTKDDIPIHFSAFGPKGRRLAAELGLNWIIPGRDMERTKAAYEDMQTAWAEAGREAVDLYSTVQTTGCILGEGEAYDSPRAKLQAGPAAAMIFHDLVEADAFGSLGFGVPDHLKPTFEKYQELYASYRPEDARYLSVHRGHLMFLRPEEEALIDGDLIRATSFTGPAQELRERVRALRELGFNEFSVHITNGQEHMLEEWSDLLEGV